MGKNESTKGQTFWTVCSSCHYMYEYEKKYEEGRILCQNCRKGFHAAAVAAPPGGFLVRGKDCKYYSGYGFFRLPRLGYSFLGDDGKEIGRGEKNDVVVEISDDSDGDERKKKMNVKNETVQRKIKRGVKAEGSNHGGGRGVIKRVKSVPVNTKKMAGRGVKGKKKLVENANVESGNGVAAAAGDCDKIAVEDDGELEFIAVDDDIFVGLRDIC